jgi:uncharacterized MAPEG superfamily protein
MTIAYICILIAAILPYIWVGIAKFSTPKYDNSSPREFLHSLNEGTAKRAHFAHLNAFEAFPAFAAGVMIAQLAGVSHQSITSISTAFILFRLLHGFCYIQNNSNLRSLAWVCGFICVISLYILAVLQ